MTEYIEKINEIIEKNKFSKNGLLITDKNGYVEYFKECEILNTYNVSKFEGFAHDKRGRHVLELYPELNEENSTVMQVLRTGKAIENKYQRLSWNGNNFALTGQTYPIIEDGKIIGAVDEVKMMIMQKDSDNNIDSLYTIDDIIGGSDVIENVKKQIKMIAESNSPVLIYGETGTGKELVAQSIHTLSERRNKPFISQNCAAIPTNLAESIFFGTERGSFTGAESRKGIFEMANGGTVFLDEINSMDLALQAKLLKAIEDKKVRRLGAEKDIPFDVRIITATNEKIEELLTGEKIRRDLFYRISVVNIEIPPLKERKKDILILSEYFIDMYNRSMRKNMRGITELGKQLMMQYDWPGNVRELRNIIECAFNLEQSDTITVYSLNELLNRIQNQKEIASKERTYVSITDNAKFGYNKKELLEKYSNEEYRTYGNNSKYDNSEMTHKGNRYIEEFNQSQIGDIEKYLLKIEREIIESMINTGEKLNKIADKLNMSPQKLQYRIKKLGINHKKK